MLRPPNTGTQAIGTAHFLSPDSVTAIHVNDEVGVLSEGGHLALNVPAAYAMSICIDELAIKTISYFLRGEITMAESLHGQGYRLLPPSALAARHYVRWVWAFSLS